MDRERYNYIHIYTTKKTKKKNIKKEKKKRTMSPYMMDAPFEFQSYWMLFQETTSQEFSLC